MIDELHKLKIKRYFIARLEDGNQDGEVFGGCFRPKDYIKKREGASVYMEHWLSASLEDVWSTKFIGLDDNGIQKLEFQNPPYVAAKRLGGDPRDYNRAFTVQVNGCTYECSFCFVQRKLNDPKLGNGSFFSARDILNYFEQARIFYWKRDAKRLNVIRLSGGEVTIVPELILDINNELLKRNLSDEVYLWVDCNLSTKRYLEYIETELKAVAKQKNFGMVGCFKTIGDGLLGKEDFEIITKADRESFQTQFDTLIYLVKEIGADLYLYLVPIINGCRSEIKSRLQAYVNRLMKIDVNLPLRTNIIHIGLYGPALENLENAAREGRPLFTFDEKMVLDIWYNEILPKLYTTKQINTYRCQIPLGSIQYDN